MGKWFDPRGWPGAACKALKLEAIALDMTGNVALLLNKPGQTMSLTFARWRTKGNPFQRGLGQRMCGMLDVFDKGHCDRVLADAEKRKSDKRGG